MDENQYRDGLWVKGVGQGWAYAKFRQEDGVLLGIKEVEVGQSYMLESHVVKTGEIIVRKKVTIRSLEEVEDIFKNMPVDELVKLDLQTDTVEGDDQLVLEVRLAKAHYDYAYCNGNLSLRSMTTTARTLDRAYDAQDALAKRKRSRVIAKCTVPAYPRNL